MALTLAFTEGQSVYFGRRTKEGVNWTHSLKVLEIITPLKCKVEIETPSMKNIREVTDTEVTEVMPSVTVQTGTNGSIYAVRLAMTAPRSIEIEHSRYREKKANAERDSQRAG